MNRLRAGEAGMSHARKIGLASCAALLMLLPLAPLVLAVGEEQSPLFLQAQRSAIRDGYAVITTPALRELLLNDPSVLLVDVRFSYEYDQSHIPGAISLPVDLRDRGDLSSQRRQAFLDALGPDKIRTIVVYCRDFR